MISIRLRNAGLKILFSSGFIAVTIASDVGIVSGSAHSFIIVSVQAFVVRMMMVFLKSISRPSPSSIFPLSNT